MVICSECCNATPSRLTGFISCKYTPKWEYQSKVFIRDCSKYEVKCSQEISPMATKSISTTARIKVRAVNVLQNQFNPFKIGK